MFRFWSLCVLAVFHRGAAKIMRETAYIYDFSPCPGVETAGLVTASFSYRKSDDYRISVDLGLNGSYNDINVLLDLKKCPTRGLVDCESYLKFPVTDICTSFHNELNYSRLLQSVAPPIDSCPLSGQYELKDFPVISEVPNLKRLLGFGYIPDNKILTCDFSLITKHQILLCVRLVGSFQLTKEMNP